MPSEPSVRVHPTGVDGDHPSGPPTAVVLHEGFRLELRFAAGDFRGDGDVQEIRVLPDTEDLKPRALRRFAPKAELYLAYAREAMRWFDPADDPTTKQARLRDAADALRAISGPGRGHTDAFYRRIAESYNALVDGGEPHPVKALSEIHQQTISAASRWIKEARNRGFIAPKEARDDA
ncbi:MAG TPA: hypothetical protein VNJ54_12745 [Plantibacter sp.]|uniref:hypothetical protein n=1 Tax=Plantibacter sp. TaxID=1871045 RepID=UPI002C70378C|nr:hypothetical protein [Plantibacter sp.]